MYDLQLLAFAAEITRVSTFKLSRDTSNRVFPESGNTTPFHTASHHSLTPQGITDFALVNRYHVGLLGYFLDRLRDTPDGDGTLLDHSLVLYGSAMGDSNTHGHKRVPMLLAGHASGSIPGNLHIQCEEETPQANILLAMMQKLGVNIDTLGDSTEPIAI